jgi:hypothetical protein
MANLITLRITLPTSLGPSFPLYNEFNSTLTDCLLQSTIEQLYLSCFHSITLSVLDNCSNIKKLALGGCFSALEPAFTSPSSQQSLETLIFSGDHDRNLHFWAVRRVSRLTSLGMRDLPPNLDWTAFLEMLTACANSLTRLDVNTEFYCK